MTSVRVARVTLPIAAAGACVVAAVGSIVGYLHGGPAIGPRLTALGLLVAAGTAFAALVMRGWRDAATRRSWMLLAGGVLAKAVWLVVAVLPAVAGRDTSAQPAGSVGHLVAAPLMIIALLLLPTSGHDARARIRTGLDAIIAALALGIVVSAASTLGGDGSGIDALQPMVDAAIGMTVVAAVVRARFEGSLSLPTLTRLAGAIIVLAAADVLSAPHLRHAGWSAGDAYLALSAVGYALLVAAATRGIEERDDFYTLRRRERLAVLAPLLPLVPVVGIVTSAVVMPLRLSGVTLVLCALLAGSLLTSAVLARLDGLRLSRTLEHRVVERTLAINTDAKWFRALVRNASDLVAVVDPRGVIRYVTPSVRRMLGYDEVSLVGTGFGDLLRADDARRLTSALMEAVLEPGRSETLEFAVRDRRGLWHEVETVVMSLVDDPDIRGIVLNARDVSERKHLERRLTEQAFSDPLTGLANRALFLERVESAVTEHRGQAGRVAVLFCDLDGFKAVNDAQGHAVGDDLLVVVAERLRQCVRPSDAVARLGGDEFAILIAGEHAETDAVAIASRVGTVLEEPFVLSGRNLQLAGSTGIAVTESGEETTEQLIRNADLAMYRAKAARDGGYVLFEAAMHDALVLRVEAEDDLRRAVERNQLVLHYQPTVNLRTGRVVGVEALVRWYHPTRGVIPPIDFIGLAEETGLVESIGEWAVREVCRQGAGWQAFVSGGVFNMAVNVSSRQLTPSLVSVVRDALAESGLPASALTIEITETVIIERPEQAIRVLRDLKALGVRIAIDDFGTGYSSLSYLSRYPVDILKIDKSFIERLGAHSESSELVRTIVQLGRALKLATVAEGIETRSQYAALLAMSCDYGQGYLFSRPLPAQGINLLFAGRSQPEEIRAQAVAAEMSA